jgi:Beta-lactamase enzyme family
VISAAGRGFADVRPSRLALSLVLPLPHGAIGFSHRGRALGYPASLVKLFFLVACHAQLEAGSLTPSKELSKALSAMIERSSNDATSHVVDLLSATTGGPALAPSALRQWLRRREVVNRYFAAWRCPELTGINLVQKTWSEAPYGRERQSCYEVANNRNRLSSDAVACLLLALEQGEIISRRRSSAMMRLLARFPDRVDARGPSNQVDGFLGAGLPAGARLWSKAGWSSRTRHDAAIVELIDGTRFILVVMTFGRSLAQNTRLLPFIAREVARGVQVLSSIQSRP